MRELRNYADRFVLGMWHGFSDAPVRPVGAASAEGALASLLERYERTVIEAELARNNGALKPTYEALQVSRKGLYDKMKRLGIKYCETSDDSLDG